VVARELELNGRKYWIISDPDGAAWKAKVTEVLENGESDEIGIEASAETPAQTSSEPAAAEGQPEAAEAGETATSETAEAAPAEATAAPAEAAVHDPRSPRDLPARAARDVVSLSTRRDRRRARDPHRVHRARDRDLRVCVIADFVFRRTSDRAP